MMLMSKTNEKWVTALAPKSVTGADLDCPVTRTDSYNLLPFTGRVFSENDRDSQNKPSVTEAAANCTNDKLS